MSEASLSTKATIQVLEHTATWLKMVEENLTDAILLNDHEYITSVPKNLAEVRQALTNCVEVLKQNS